MHPDSASRPSSEGALPCEELRGTIESVRYVSGHSGWSVLKVRTLSGELVTLVGIAAGASIGEQIRGEGHWVQHPTFGRQFQARQIVSLPSPTPQALERYLSSGIILGVGPHTARTLVSHFGTRVNHVLDQNPSELEQVKGIGPVRRQQILRSWQNSGSDHEILLALHEQGLTQGPAAKLHRHYGARTLQILKSNPYRVADEVPGIGFTTADHIARTLELSPEDPRRIDAGLAHIVDRAQRDGHCAVSEQQLLRATAELLELPPEPLLEGLRRCAGGQRLVWEELGNEALIYTPRLRESEAAVAAHLRRLSQGAPPWGSVSESTLECAERQTGKRLSDSQREALRGVLRHKVCILTGGPGAGKTTLTRILLNALKDRVASFAPCAPTAVAARRLEQACGVEAMTLHRRLQGRPGAHHFRRNRRNPLEADVVLVDEMSMVDVEMMRALLEATPDHCALILIGDPEQLPSVAPGQVLQDLIASGRIATERLTEPHRQTAESGVIRNAYRINRGLMPLCTDDPDDDFRWIVEDDVSEIASRVLDLVTEDLPRQYGLDPVHDVQVLTPMHRGSLGTVALNRLLQQRLNPNPTDIVRVGTLSFAVGDRVLHTNNNYRKGVFNGDVGILRSVESRRRAVMVEFDGRPVHYRLSELKDLVLASAMTVHRAQGNEYPAVVIPVCTEHSALLTKRILYTAVTRGKRVILMGQKQAVQRALQSNRNEQRCTGLRHRLLA